MHTGTAVTRLFVSLGSKQYTRSLVRDVRSNLFVKWEKTQKLRGVYTHSLDYMHDSCVAAFAAVSICCCNLQHDLVS